MSRRRPPQSRALEAAGVLAIGLVILTVGALVLYRPGAPGWTHLVIDGTAWVPVLSTGAVITVAAVEKLVEVVRRRPLH